MNFYFIFCFFLCIINNLTQFFFATKVLGRVEMKK